MPAQNNNREGLDQDPFWYKSGVIYEVHVRAFYDANGDGSGDFRGLTEKLDYIKDLGVTAIWLLPFYPSPLKDDGYDIADYCAVHPMYGTLADFKTFLHEAHRRGLRVISELVLNHTSDQHPWFQRARRAKPGSRWRNYYVWSDDPQQYKDAPIIFKDVEVSNWTLDPVAKAYFWHRFFSHQPDLNYDNPEVHKAMFKVVDFWLDLGVDGMRLDAVPYLYEREGTACENLPETHAFLKSLRAHVDEKYRDRMLLAEANLWPEDAVTYFGQGRGDECHMAFHFPLMPRLFMALRMEDRLPITDIIEQTPPIPETSQWALFLRNHDELTLSTVTDEERDYMYRMYAQVHQARLYLGIRRRLAPLLNNDRKSIELLNALLFSLPGTPVLYYGDEIGLGENIYLGDRNGVRTPMQWSSDKNAGFSRANPQSLYLPIILDPAYHYEANNVETQLVNPHSLLWWMRRLLALRKRWRALGEGKCEFLHPDNHKILSYVLRHENEALLVIANLSRFVQPVELDLTAFKQRTPVELFGRTDFPVITEKPYFLTLGPHGFYWFSLETKPGHAPIPSVTGAPAKLPALTAVGRWQEVLVGNARTGLEAVLPDYFKVQRWFGSQSRNVKTLTLKETIAVPLAGCTDAALTFWQVEFVGANPELYVLPLAFATGPEAEQLRQHHPRLVIAELNLMNPAQNGILFDAIGSAAFCRELLELISTRQRLRNARGEVEGLRAPVLRQLLDTTLHPTADIDPVSSSTPAQPAGLETGTPPARPLAEVVPGRGEHNNSPVFFGDKLILKLFRRLEPGMNPDLEIGRFLTEQEFPHAAPLAGAIEYARTDGTHFTLAVATQFLPNAGTARDFTLDGLGRYFDRVTAWVAQGRTAPAFPGELVKLLQSDVPQEVAADIGSFLESARLLGTRTAELHLALASAPAGSELASEPFTPQYQRALFQSLRNRAVQTLRLLRKQLKSLPADLLLPAQGVAGLEAEILGQYRQFSERRLAAQRIRIHGALHLGDVLWTGRDFVFIDFEGETAAALSERRIKRSPLRDVASLVRSFHYTAYAGLQQHVERGGIPHESRTRFESWVRHWNLWVSVAFLRAYLHRLGPDGLLPGKEDDLRVLLRAYLLNQIVNELGRELKTPAGQLRIPLQGILYLVGEPTPPPAAGGAPASGTKDAPPS
jgi:maltose alpha-D-glucosyltransferase / alpha-amylase